MNVNKKKQMELIVISFYYIINIYPECEANDDCPKNWYCQEEKCHRNKSGKTGIKSYLNVLTISNESY